MKKKVRYAAGIAGAAVPALGLMIPVAATAATAQKPAAGGKTVTLLQHAAAKIVACTGKTQAVTTNNDNSVQRFWWTNSGKSHNGGETVCIGTVEGFDADGLEPGQGYFRVRIYDFPGREGSKVLQYSHHIQTSLRSRPQFNFSDPVHSLFGASPVQVCTAFVYVPGGVIRPLICHSVK
jgi:hypothetical protein